MAHETSKASVSAAQTPAQPVLGAFAPPLDRDAMGASQVRDWIEAAPAPILQHKTTLTPGISPDAIDRAAEALRTFQLRGKFTVAFADMPNPQKKKWREAARLALMAALFPQVQP